MTIPRREIVDESRPGIYHLTARCVRRAFLCGFDRYSRKDYGHRRGWIVERIQYLLENFAIDMLAYAIMSNHMHQEVRNRPDIARSWSAREVAERWLRVVSTHQRPDGNPRSPTEEDIEVLARKPKRIEVLRKRLSSISCYMAKLNEFISRKANKEDGVPGRFWEGRFKSTRLDDAAAILACMTYIDLNPVRAKMSESLQDSEYTSAQDRYVAELARQRVAEYRKRRRKGEILSERQESLLAAARQRAKRADWLLALDRADSPLRGITESAYLELADWTGRQIRTDKRGRIPDHILPILQELDIHTKRWVRTVEKYGSLFHRLVARTETMAQAAAAVGRQWFHGVRACRELYASEAQRA